MLVPTDCGTELAFDVHEVDMTEVGSELLVHVVVCQGESSPVVAPGCDVAMGPAANDDEMGDGQIVTSSGGCMVAVLLAPRLGPVDERVTVADTMEVSEFEGRGIVTDVVEVGPTDETKTVDAEVANEWEPPPTVTSVVNSTTVDEPYPMGTV